MTEEAVEGQGVLNHSGIFIGGQAVGCDEDEVQGTAGFEGGAE